ncbi:MAG: hypothetical protein IPO05_06770 [Flavobacteriales bacterium]|jgi:hypothetical protein|nr:hypothetical protein [Flavobacteriales bacterium]
MNLVRIVSPLLVLVALSANGQYVEKGIQDGIAVAYRWKHSIGAPSQLLLRMENTTTEDKHVDLVIDLYYQGLTVETLRADTCIRAGQVLNGKVNGIYFIPERLTTEQIKSGDALAEWTNTTIEPAICP